MNVHLSPVTGQVSPDTTFGCRRANKKVHEAGLLYEPVVKKRCHDERI